MDVHREGEVQQKGSVRNKELKGSLVKPLSRSDNSNVVAIAAHHFLNQFTKVKQMEFRVLKDYKGSSICRPKLCSTVTYSRGYPSSN
jgi:hypothetical protein